MNCFRSPTSSRKGKVSMLLSKRLRRVLKAWMMMSNLREAESATRQEQKAPVKELSLKIS